MTTEQLIDIFSKMHEGTNNIWVTYKKELELTKDAKNNGENPADYYKVVTRLCRGDFDYYNGKAGKASLAQGNQKTSMPGTTGNVKNANGDYIPGIYTSPKGDRVRFYPSGWGFDKLRLFVKGQEVQLQDIQNLINQGILKPSAAKTKPDSDYMGPYVATLINVVIRHKDGSEEIGDNTAFKYSKDYHESLEESFMDISKMPMMSENERELIIPNAMEESCQESCNEDYGWEFDTARAWDIFEQMREELGDEELLTNLAKAMGNEELADLLAFIARQYDMDYLLDSDEEPEAEFEIDDEYDGLEQ